MSKTTNRFSSEVRAPAVRMVLDHEGAHRSRRTAIVSISEKYGCVPQTLHERVKKTGADGGTSVPARRDRLPLTPMSTGRRGPFGTLDGGR